MRLTATCPYHKRSCGGSALGVKYLHEAAHGADLGIYFEANGHGTVLFSKQLLQRLREVGRCLRSLPYSAPRCLHDAACNA